MTQPSALCSWAKGYEPPTSFVRRPPLPSIPTTCNRTRGNSFELGPPETVALRNVHRYLPRAAAALSRNAARDGAEFLFLVAPRAHTTRRDRSVTALPSYFFCFFFRSRIGMHEAWRKRLHYVTCTSYCLVPPRRFPRTLPATAMNLYVFFSRRPQNTARQK